MNQSHSEHSRTLAIEGNTIIDRVMYPALLHGNNRPIQQVTGDEAVRLYQSLRSENSVSIEESFHSTNEYGQTCRICRVINSSQEIVPCPCRCTGSVGFVHIKCLQRWVRFKRNNRCEICRELFDISLDKPDYRALFASFFKPKYIGSIIKNILNLIAVTPLVYFTMNQLVYSMDHINEHPNLFKLLIIGPGMLLGTSIYFFLYFDWALTCLFRIRNILIHWWNFGDQDYDEFNPESSFDSLTDFLMLD